MYKRGEIRNDEYAKVIYSFTALRYGNITPSDIDGYGYTTVPGCIEYKRNCFVFIEMKYQNGSSELDTGQRLMYERMVDDHKSPAVCIVGEWTERNLNERGHVDVASCVVKKYYKQYSNGNWPVIPVYMTVKKCIDDFLESHNVENSIPF